MPTFLIKASTNYTIEYYIKVIYNRAMWEVEYTDEFEEWWFTLSEATQDSITTVVTLLEERGAMLSFPYSSAIYNSRHSHMRELRIQHQGSPIRIFYAFDPLRQAILLIGGDKTGNNSFYEEYVPIADRLYDEYLEELRKEGRI